MTDQINETGKNFLLELFRQADGKTSAKVSMYDVGAAIGTDKPTSKHIAEELMAWNLIEIRTLSGGIAITDNGIEKARQMGAGVGSASAACLGSAPIADDAVRQAADNLLAVLKSGASKAVPNFDTLCELIADIRTIEAQLFSTKPKTAIIRECFRSIRGVLETAGAKEYLAQVKSLLGE